MICKFCEDYKELRELSGEKQARRKSEFVAVLREDIEKGGCVSYGSYELNYCPSCGRKLEEKMVRCIDCEHLRTMLTLTQGNHFPDAICASPIWKELGKPPHVVRHDLYKPIRCDHFEKKEGQNSGKI